MLIILDPHRWCPYLKMAMLARFRWYRIQMWMDMNHLLISCRSITQWGLSLLLHDVTKCCMGGEEAASFQFCAVQYITYCTCGPKIGGHQNSRVTLQATVHSLGFAMHFSVVSFLSKTSYLMFNLKWYIVKVRMQIIEMPLAGCPAWR